MSIKHVVWASLVGLGPLLVAAPMVGHAESAALAGLDEDNDGTVNLTEAQDAGMRKFAAADPDGDGTLDAKEAARGGMGASAFAMVDLDRDGTVDKTEYMTAIEGQFKAADTDHDGTLDRQEMQSPAGRKLAKMIE